MCVNKAIYQDALTVAYTHFNKALFAGALPEAVLTLQPRKKSAGHFANNRWTAGGDRYHEININPTVIEEQGERQLMQTLVHEMCHLWQEVFGKPSRSGYHNREWVRVMREIGLEPVSLDSDNGTGQRVSDKIIEGGRFSTAYDKLAGRKSWTGIDWHRVDDSHLEGGGKPAGGGSEGEGGSRRKPGTKRKARYSCPSCGNNAWGKPGMQFACLCVVGQVNIMTES